MTPMASDEMPTLLEFIHMQALLCVQNPEHELPAAIQDFCNAQSDAPMAAVVITAIAIQMVARTFTDLLGAEEASNKLLDDLTMIRRIEVTDG